MNDFFQAGLVYLVKPKGLSVDKQVPMDQDHMTYVYSSTSCLQQQLSRSLSSLPDGQRSWLCPHPSSGFGH
jgi:hypothetical protein